MGDKDINNNGGKNRVYLPINKWSEDERPREKLLLHGKNTLSNVELIALLIRSGCKEKSAIDVAKELLDNYGGKLSNIAKLDVNELGKFKGIGKAKAICILAALELSNRLLKEDCGNIVKIISSEDAYRYLLRYYKDLRTEEFRVIYLNRANNVIDCKLIGKGGLSQTSVDLRIIFKYAIDSSASSIILSHNHPSGNIEPSDADINITRRIKEAGSIVDIKLLDHIIIGMGNNNYFSFIDENIEF